MQQRKALFIVAGALGFLVLAFALARHAQEYNRMKQELVTIRNQRTVVPPTAIRPVAVPPAQRPQVAAQNTLTSQQRQEIAAYVRDARMFINPVRESIADLGRLTREFQTMPPAGKTAVWWETWARQAAVDCSVIKNVGEVLFSPSDTLPRECREVHAILMSTAVRCARFGDRFVNEVPNLRDYSQLSPGFIQEANEIYNNLGEFDRRCEMLLRL